MPKIVYIVTVPMTAKAFMRGHLSYMRDRGYDVTLISSPESELVDVAKQESVSVVGINIAREIDFFGDMVSLWQLYRTLVAIKPDIVNASTPKAGFLGMLAAWLARVPVRIYLLRGLRAETASGIKKLILNTTERLASMSAHHVVAVSESLSQVYVRAGLVASTKLTMVGSGSSNGVNPDRFLPTPDTLQRTDELCKQLNLSADTPVIGFVGRFTRDKGIIELISAFEIIQASFPTAKLLLVGGFEEGDSLPSAIIAQIEGNPAIINTGFVKDTSPYYPLMKVFAFPSYREGFPNSPLEASLSGVPTVGFKATGVVDAIQDGITGKIVPLGDVNGLANEMLKLLADEAYCRQIGDAAKARALAEFQPQQVWTKWHRFYQELLQESSV
jgi:glycosyltransferase involved in cell wall biosynthesis